MSILAVRSLDKEDKSNIITLGAIAKDAKLKDSSVINATIGMLYDEEGKLFTFQSVDKVLSQMTSDEKYAYASTPGSKDFHEALKHWIFRQYYDEITKNCFTSVMATPGGTGALSNTIANYLDRNDKVLVPSYMWGNYKQIAKEYDCGYLTYDLFNAYGKFNLVDLEAKIKTLASKQKNIVVIINDPCHNPTGYSMSEEEWVELINIINKNSTNNPIILLHDMAYIDYDYRGFNFTRKNITLYNRLNSNAMAILAFSGSKTLALYGIRIGAQVAISSNVNNINDFDRANKFSSRSKWSNTSNLGINLVSKIILDEQMRINFEEELEKARQTLITRANTFLDGCKKCNLETLPFQCGFFITIPCENAMEVYEKLVEQKVHVIPMGNVLRVTISAISVKECSLLPLVIKNAMLKE